MVAEQKVLAALLTCRQLSQNTLKYSKFRRRREWLRAKLSCLIATAV